ncbi:DUF5706 domain-containing protein [Streptomyces sp. 8L]|nr:DUF5706 domain-containing protein [Streptomyces sp. 8L]
MRENANGHATVCRATTDRTDKNLDAACATTASEISRADGKASLLLAFNGAVLAGLASLADKPLPVPARIIGALAIAALGLAAVLLLAVVCPRIEGEDRASFPYWAQLDEDAIAASMARDTRTARVRVLSLFAVTKFRQLRQAIYLTRAALALLALAALSAAL